MAGPVGPAIPVVASVRKIGGVPMVSFLVEVRTKDGCDNWKAWQVYDDLDIHAVLNVCGVYVANAFEYRAKRLHGSERLTALQRLHHERGFR